MDLCYRKCTGKSVTVNSDSTAHISIEGNSEHPIVAFHIGMYKVAYCNISVIIKCYY